MIQKGKHFGIVQMTRTQYGVIELKTKLYCGVWYAPWSTANNDWRMMEDRCPNGL